MKKILFVSGSLRRESFNTQLLRMAADILSDEFECSFLDYKDLPFLDQDIEYPAPAAVERIREEVAASDAVWLGSPEYNHSFSAALKNLVDWLSRPVVPGDYSTAAGRGKIIALSSAAGSSGGAFSIASLRNLLGMLSSDMVAAQTLVALGSRSGEKDLVLSESEKAMLLEECDELRAKLAD